MKIVRNPVYMVDIAPSITDAHIWAAITPPRAWVEFARPCPEGTIYRVFGYTFPVAGARRPITVEDLYGASLEEFLLEVQYLAPIDKPDEAHIMYAFEADERGFWEYGGSGEEEA